MGLIILSSAEGVKHADLQPPLGKPGGPCQVIRRIDQQVRHPLLSRDLIEDVSSGDDLSNGDASKVYPLDVEPGVGPIRQLRITSHAQYRMDLRGITVEDIRSTLGGFLATLQEWQDQGAPAAKQYTEALRSGSKIEWVDRKTRLKVVFEPAGSVITVISAFWKGVPDPGPMQGACRRASAVSVLRRFLRGA